MTEMAKKKLLSEYQAAAVSGLSPELLRWLTKNAPKQGVSRKLKVAEVKGETYFYERRRASVVQQLAEVSLASQGGKAPAYDAEVFKMLIGQLGEDKIIASRNWPNDRETKDSYNAPYRIIMPDRKLDA